MYGSATGVAKFTYEVRVTRAYDGASWYVVKEFHDFVSLDADLRRAAIFHRNCARGHDAPALPSKRTMLALWGRRRALWLANLPVELKRYFEQVLQRTGVRECHPIQQFLTPAMHQAASRQVRSARAPPTARRDYSQGLTPQEWEILGNLRHVDDIHEEERWDRRRWADEDLADERERRRMREYGIRTTMGDSPRV